MTAGILYAAWSGDSVIVPSPPGAGKTRLVVLLASTLADRAGLRVGIAAQTRAQAVEVAARLGRLTARARLCLPKDASVPDVPGCAYGAQMTYPPRGGGVLVATTAKWLWANPRSVGCDVLIVDEAWQATHADVRALGAFAPQMVMVGDPGQIDPVVTGPTGRWDGSATGPHLPGPAALVAAYGDDLAVHHLRHTWRLGPATTALIQPAFYPDLPFTSRRPPEHLADAAGQAVPELATVPVAATGPGDPALVHAAADRARDLLTATLHTPTGERRLSPADIAVVCPHVSQAAAVRALLADLDGVQVGTANALQGMEAAAAVVVHPLAGYRDLSAFGLDLGRTCVMLSRHRAHLSVVTDPATRGLLDTADPDPALRVHAHLLDALSK